MAPARSQRRTSSGLAALAPRTGASYEHWLSGDPPLRPETITPAEAFARYGRASSPSAAAAA